MRGGDQSVYKGEIRVAKHAIKQTGDINESAGKLLFSD